MRNSRTFRVIYGKSFQNRIAEFMRTHGLIKINYQLPMFDEAGHEIGAICTVTGNKRAIWLLGRLFKKETSVGMFDLWDGLVV